MKIWTLQDCAILDDLQTQGFACCDRQSALCDDFRFAYDWMVEQMKLRIGEPPLESIRYPLWGWAQYTSRKSPKPPYSPALLDSDKDRSVFIEADVPDGEVLLSDFMRWNTILSGWYLLRNRELERRMVRFAAQNDCGYDFNAYPEALREEIMESWRWVFDFGMREKGSAHKRNRAIQATFWRLKREYILSTHIIKR